MFKLVYISLYPINNTKQLIMQHLSNFLLVSQFVLFVIVLSNMARLVIDSLIIKSK